MYFITTEESWKLSESLKLRRVFIRRETYMLVSQQCSLARVFLFAYQTLKVFYKNSVSLWYYLTVVFIQWFLNTSDIKYSNK